MFLLALWMAAVDPSQGLLGEWVRAQNAGDFTAYQSLYAQKFTGVRRSGPRVVRLDRQGWMKDRQRMFKHPMVVATSEIKIATSGAGAAVTFVQTWSGPDSGYRDVGRKVMVLMPEGGALRIVREEMLESKLADPAGAAIAEENFSLVVEGRVVLSKATAGPWATGKPARWSVEEPWEAAVRRVDDAKLPPAQLAWRGRKLRLFDFKGPVCEGTLQGFEQIRRVVIHFGALEDWKEKHTPDARIAKEIWAEADGEDSDLLLGTIDRGAGCKDATWARAQSLPAPKIITPVPADPVLAARVLQEFRKLPAWKNLQAAYRGNQELKPKGRWDEYDGAHPEVKRLGPLVYVNAWAGTGCEELGGDLWALWEARGDKLILRNKPQEKITAREPRAAVDVDGDGVLEILLDEGILRRVGEYYGAPQQLEVPFHDCPC